jgi:hypothetical protein
MADPQPGQVIYCTTSVTVLDCTSAPEVPVIPT